MSYRIILTCGLILALWLLATCTPNNVALGPNLPDSETDGNVPAIEVEAAREGVYLVQNGERQPLPLTERVPLSVGQRVAVDDSGRAILYVGNMLTLELLQAAEVEIQQLAGIGESTAITVWQDGGDVVADFTPSLDTSIRFTLQTPSAAVVAIDEARFGVVNETNSALTWVLGLEAEDENLQITANGVTQPLVGGQARWVAQDRPPGPVVPINQSAEAWLGVVRNSTPDTELGEVLLPLANLLVDTGTFTSLPAPGRAVELIRDETLGPVMLTLDDKGIFGNPDYILQDCNADGVQDIAIVNGILILDFSDMQARVQGLDVDVFNQDAPGQGALQILNPAGAELDRQQLWVGNGATQTLSLRTDQPQHRANLVVSNACFLGLSLTPSATPVENQVQADAPATPQSVAETPQNGDVVVNILQTPIATTPLTATSVAVSAERLPQNGQLQAPFVGGEGGSLIQIDGSQGDWDALTGQEGVEWTAFSTITYDNGCANRYPDSGSLVDLEGRVQLAYDDQNLYVAFVVNDDGLVTYSGQDERYFLGDAPQLMLDLNLDGDYNDTQLSADDVQIDFDPNPNAPRAALWQLSSLSARVLAEAVMAVTPTDTGYFLEAALPWPLLNVSPQPGTQLGLAAGINENDTPDTDVQECIISTSPQRNWRNPATWGTVLLMPQ